MICCASADRRWYERSASKPRASTAYVETYLTQEIRAEALLRSLESFARFLEVAALANGQVTNVTSLARDSAVARPTVQGYFEVLVVTRVAGPHGVCQLRRQVSLLPHAFRDGSGFHGAAASITSESK